MKITIKIDDSEVKALLAGLKNQIPYSVALGCTRLAQAAQAEVTRQLPTIFDRPNPFTLNAIAIVPASKSSLTSSVYIRPQQAKYLSVEISGGVIYPPGRALPTPVDAPRTIYGGLPLTAVAQALRRKADTFSATIHGHPGIWRRLPDGHLILLISWAPKWEYKPRFAFEDIVLKVVAQQVGPIMRDAMAQAVATAR